MLDLDIFPVPFNRTAHQAAKVMAREDDSEFGFSTAVRGFHVYRRVWFPHPGQHLRAEREHMNAEDRFVIAVRERSGAGADEDADNRPIVGHLPRELSKELWYFLLHGGVLECKVTGRRQRSPLEQGGLEIPCRVTLRGRKKMVARAKELLEKKTQVSTFNI